MTQLREDGGLDQVVMVKLLSSGWKMDGCILKLEPTDLLADQTKHEKKKEKKRGVKEDYRYFGLNNFFVLNKLLFYVDKCSGYLLLCNICLQA